MPQLDADFEQAAQEAFKNDVSMFKGDDALRFARSVAYSWQAISEEAAALGVTRLSVVTQASRPGSHGCVAMGAFKDNDYDLSRDACLEYTRTQQGCFSFVKKWKGCWE